MTRLQSELHRLYGVQDPVDALADDAQAPVRAMVLALARPADWALLSGIWQGVQADLGLPAPAIAVSGMDAFQLWFSLAEPLAWAQARAFLDALRMRHLSEVPPERVGLMPAGHALATLPPQQFGDEQWSAFVAPDLAPVFAGTPWLDIPPNLDGQADLLSRLVSIQPVDFQRAMRLLTTPAVVASAGDAGASATAPIGSCAGRGRYQEPKGFLLDVMNDESVALALRIEAAKALLRST